MKKKFILSFIFLSLTISACGSKEPQDMPAFVFANEVFTGQPEAANLTQEEVSDPYLSPSSWGDPLSNQDVIETRGEEEGKAYINATQRVDGFAKVFLLTDTDFTSPPRIRSTVVFFADAEGAATAFEAPWNPDFVDEEAVIQDVEVSLGDRSYAVAYHDAATPEKDALKYEVVFIYRNAMVVITAWGLEDVINHDEIQSLAQIVFDKLRAAETISP